MVTVFFLPLNFQPNEAMTIGHRLNSQPSEGTGVNTPLKLFFVWVYYVIRICARFRSTPKHGISGPNLPLHLIFTAFFFFYYTFANFRVRLSCYPTARITCPTSCPDRKSRIRFQPLSDNSCTDVTCYGGARMSIVRPYMSYTNLIKRKN